MWSLTEPPVVLTEGGGPTWTFKQPLVSSDPLHASIVLEVQQGLEAQGRVWVHDQQRGHVLETHTGQNPGPPGSVQQNHTDLPHLLSGVQGERVLGQADLLVGVPQLGLTRLVEQDLVVVVAGDGVGDHAVVSRRDHDHPDRREQNPEGGANRPVLVQNQRGSEGPKSWFTDRSLSWRM